MPEEKGFARINHHVVAEVGTGRHQGAKFFGAIRMAALLTDHKHFPCMDPTNVQRTDGPAACFLDLQLTFTGRTLRDRGSELHYGWLGKQIGH